MSTPFNQHFFNSIAYEFDEHVRNSIPLFDEFIKNLQNNILDQHANDQEYTILDICGSTGLFGATLFEQGFKGDYVNLDGSPEMADISYEFSLQFENHHTILGGFMASWVDESGINIPLNDTKGGNYDLILEILGFQFFTKSRDAEIKEVKASLSSKGQAVFCEKFSDEERIFMQREEIKDKLHKQLHFSKEEIQSKKDNVLVPMGDYLFNRNEFLSLLMDNFNYVERIYEAGNFIAYIASDIPIDYIKQSELLTNKFNVYEKR